MGGELHFLEVFLIEILEAVQHHFLVPSFCYQFMDQLESVV